MLNLPSVELLESRHQFPCSFVFKAIGTTESRFAARVIAVVREELQLAEDPPFSTRTDRSGRHVSVTMEPLCESSQQVLAVYGRITGMDGLVMLL
ncbi:MAG: DUF493 domain-containing protein [Planctomycetaceae bacterium]|nr:DUF493 domain-containing protein [Planctomycetaceae bacterium]